LRADSEPSMTSFAASERVAPDEAPRSLAERLLNAVERSHLRACTVLLLLSLACFLPGFASLQPMDRDEPRYAQASKQMLESGDFVDIRFQDEARHKKPVGIYWMQSAAVAAAEALGVADARTTIALYRIPSLFGALGTVLLTYWAALAFLGRRGAFLSAAFMGTSVILMVEARLGKTDAMLTLCSVAVMGALARAYFGRGAKLLPVGTRLGFWIALLAGERDRVVVERVSGAEQDHEIRRLALGQLEQGEGDRRSGAAQIEMRRRDPRRHAGRGGRLAHRFRLGVVPAQELAQLVRLGGIRVAGQRRLAHGERAVFVGLLAAALLETWRFEQIQPVEIGDESADALAVLHVAGLGDHA
jgi:hypothetical protein